MDLYGFIWIYRMFEGFWWGIYQLDVTGSNGTQGPQAILCISSAKTRRGLGVFRPPALRFVLAEDHSAKEKNGFS